MSLVCREVCLLIIRGVRIFFLPTDPSSTLQELSVYNLLKLYYLFENTSNSKKRKIPKRGRKKRKGQGKGVFCKKILVVNHVDYKWIVCHVCLPCFFFLIRKKSRKKRSGQFFPFFFKTWENSEVSRLYFLLFECFSSREERFFTIQYLGLFRRCQTVSHE